ncbi:MAG: exosome protein [Desulfurococcales archaeon ex4484_58]|nr:MAG: exosome protein [Desulfurococcales archaeon ex4484_58]
MIRIHELEITTHCHATEDCSKVLKAIFNIVPPSLRDRIEVHKQLLHGYYGNEIVVYTVKVKDQADEILSYLASKLSDSEKAILSATLDLRYDHRTNKLYLRINKQEAFKDNIILYDSDDIVKITLSFKHSRGIKRVREYLREKGLIK